MRSFFTNSLTILTLLALGSRGACQGPPAGFSLETLTRGVVSNSCAMAFAPDGRLFITERNTGVIRILDHGKLGGIWAQVGTITSNGAEAGLLGIAIDPDFLRNGYVYVFYTQTSSPRWTNVVARLKDAGGKGTQLTVLSPATPATGQHPGGPLEFGPDGKLYVCMGEGGIGPIAQSLGDTLGKILRMNADGTVPNDNPLVGKKGLDPLIWSWGHRNPFGLTFGPHHGQPFVTENSGGGGDEINLIQKGGNFGWPIHDGKEKVPDPSTVDPLWTFRPEPSLTGASFLTGVNYPAQYRNAMFVTDYNTATLRYLTLDPTGRRVTAQTVFHVHKGGTLLDTAEGPDGNLWILHSAQSLRGCDTVSRYIHNSTPVPSAHLSATSNRAVGGSITVGVSGKNGQSSRAWLSLNKLSTPIQTPFGKVWIPFDLVLPPTTVGGDDRAYLGIPIPELPFLRGKTLYVQAVTAAGTTLKLTPPAEMRLR